jgi:ribosomal protein S18 acetylase RimI-like enzyme
MERLRETGADGMHLQVQPANLGAQAFYRRLGFARVEDQSLPGHTIFMARRLAA